MSKGKKMSENCGITAETLSLFNNTTQAKLKALQELEADAKTKSSEELRNVRYHIISFIKEGAQAKNAQIEIQNNEEGAKRFVEFIKIHSFSELSQLKTCEWNMLEYLNRHELSDFLKYVLNHGRLRLLKYIQSHIKFDLIGKFFLSSDKIFKRSFFKDRENLEGCWHILLYIKENSKFVIADEIYCSKQEIMDQMKEELDVAKIGYGGTASLVKKYEDTFDPDA